MHTLLAEHRPEHTEDFDKDKTTVGSPGDETQMFGPGMDTWCSERKMVSWMRRKSVVT